MKPLQLSSDFSAKNRMLTGSNDKIGLRFAFSRHEMPANSARSSHFDLFLDCGPNLLTWELSESLTLNNPQQARRLPNHRRTYLEYSGPVSGDRGFVEIIDSGPLTWLLAESNLLIARLSGSIIAGELILQPRSLQSSSLQNIFRDSSPPNVQSSPLQLADQDSLPEPERRKSGAPQCTPLPSPDSLPEPTDVDQLWSLILRPTPT
jgi:hypothetical protein